MTSRTDLEESVDVDWDVRYRETPEQDLLLDHYHPPGPESTGLVFVHGGAWRSGDREHFTKQAAALSTAGYTCATIDYRLSGVATYPAAVTDVVAAVEWLQDHGVDRIGLVGGSAGGHLAALVALAPETVDADVTIDALVLFNPVLDIPAAGTGPLQQACEAFFGTDYESDPELYEEASPLVYVGPEDGEKRTASSQTPPPTLVCHGTDDDIASFEASEQFCEGICSTGSDGTLFSAPGAQHAFFNETPWYERTFCEMAGFLQAACPP